MYRLWGCQGWWRCRWCGLVFRSVFAGEELIGIIQKNSVEHNKDAGSKVR